MKDKNPIQYPLLMPQTIANVYINNPDELQEHLSKFVKDWGETEFEFSGKTIIIHNEKFNIFKSRQADLICESYEQHRNKNFD